MNKVYQLLRFLLAGGVGLLLYYGLLYTLTEWAGVWYLISAIIGFVACYSVNFTLHRKWTFASNSPAVKRQLIQYISLVGATFLLNTALLYVLVEWVHLWYLPAQAILTILLTMSSFLASRKIFAR